MPDTIFALATAPGKSGISIVRISGSGAGAAFAAFRVAPPSPRVATLATLRLPDGSALDTAIVLFFPSPASFTGEDCVEFQTHGGRAIQMGLLDALSRIPGFRSADPGEFARRAYLNGKLDLTAAEGLADLIDAETEAQRRQAYRMMQGEAAAFYEGLRESVITSLALYEAYIDFPEEDIPDDVVEETRVIVMKLCDIIERQLESRSAERVRDGLRVAIIGPANAGKSSLLNYLAKRDVAIVSEIAGTTRDVIEVQMDIGGHAVTLSDTAGIRNAHDPIEREGISRSYTQAKEADMRIIVIDASCSHDANALPSIGALVQQADFIIANKCDIGDPKISVPQMPTVLPVSIRTGEGMGEFWKILTEKVRSFTVSEAAFITQIRQRHHLAEALNHLRNYLALGVKGLEIECEELRRAAVEIGKITGRIQTEAILDVVFGRFCIGK